MLRRGSAGRDILVTRRARLDWQALTLNPYDSSLFSALADALRRERVLGQFNEAMDDPGEVYAFVFEYETDHGSVPVYAKINLQPGGKIIIIYSAHRPLKEDELTNETD